MPAPGDGARVLGKMGPCYRCSGQRVPLRPCVRGTPQLALGRRHERNPAWPQGMGAALCPGQEDKTRDTCCMGMGAHHRTCRRPKCHLTLVFGWDFQEETLLPGTPCPQPSLAISHPLPGHHIFFSQGEAALLTASPA